MKSSKIAASVILSLAALGANAQQFTAGESSAYCAGLMAAASSNTKNKVFDEAGAGFLEILKTELRARRITEERAAFIFEGTLNQVANPSKVDLVLASTKDCLKTAVRLGFVK